MSVNVLGVLEGGVTVTAFCFNRTELASRQETERVAGRPVTGVRGHREG